MKEFFDIVQWTILLIIVTFVLIHFLDSLGGIIQ